MVEYLEQLEYQDSISLAEGVRNFCVRNSGQGIAVLISDLFDKDGFEEGLRYLVAQRMDVFVLHVLSPEELNPDHRGDLKLVDCEDGDKAEISVSKPLLDRYQRTLATFTQRANTFCGQRGMTYIMTSTEVPIAELITRYLRRRGLVR